MAPRIVFMAVDQADPVDLGSSPMVMLHYCDAGSKQVWYCKNPKILDARKFAVITLKVGQDGVSLEQCIQKKQRELQNSVDPDQTAALGAV